MDGEPPSLEPGAVTKIHALNFPRDEKTPNDLVQVEPASVRLGHGGLCVLGVRIGEGGGGVALGFQCRQAGAREFLCLQVRFRAGNGGLGGIEIRRGRRRRARRPGSGDGLTSVAHLLHGSAGASGEAGNTDKYSKETQHRVRGH